MSIKTGVVIVKSHWFEMVLRAKEFLPRWRAKEVEQLITEPDVAENALSSQVVNCIRAIERSVESERVSVGMYCLRKAYLSGCLEDFIQIIPHCSDINISCGTVSDRKHRMNSTLLHECVKDGAIHFVKVLIECGADPNITLNHRFESTVYEATHTTPLHSAVLGGDINLVQLLIGAGANLHAVDDNGNTALCAAALNDNMDVATALLKAGANPNQVHDTVICPLISAQSTAMTDLLLRHGADPNLMLENGYPLLSALILKRKINIARYLIKIHVCSYQLREMEEELLDRHPLWIAYYCGEFEVFKDLANFANINQHGCYDLGLLEFSVREDTCDYARVLLEHMMRGNLRIDSELLYLAKSRRMQEMLIQFGADPTIKSADYYGKTPDEYMQQSHIDRKFVWRDLVERGPRIFAEHQRKLLMESLDIKDEQQPVKRKM
ncbi:TPA: ankyrin repeat domain-containing protein [Stenotrophomonas maltophilia]|nr:ankyrin repeat domain-containing protein [Stenotrophomonas maltophilia]MBH1463633.1 ankyrin repeat domain-containing protein [Stenotrophomonas maltophilia]MBH1613817.1 ankyrin repeat domain-containing protein [Stenotrophomonas maltophilia]MBN5166246.1 ankyrin repeat domain-containing protein [Stenotrophomonas maltophilia]HDX0879927.1 ankyrin repeat domain-containing protein [Stenotrophomonas maltophilia]